MKNKKFLSLLLSCVMLLSLAVPVNSEQVTTEKSSNVTITYGVEESFIVSIPATLNIDSSRKASSTISASNVLLESQNTLEVYISGDDYTSSWELINTANDSISLTYTIGTTENGNDVVNNSKVLSVNSGDAWDSEVSQRLYFYVVDELSQSGEYSDTLTFTAVVLKKQGSGSYPEPENIVYHGSLSDAIAAATGGSNTDTGISSSDAKAAVGDVNGTPALILMENSELTETINIDNDMILDLNGYELTSTATNAITTSANVVIDGSASGSAITLNAADGQKGTILNATSGELTVNGGTYTVNTSRAGTSSSPNNAVNVASGATLNLNNAAVTSVDSNNGTVVGINVASGATFNATGSEILASTTKALDNYGIKNYGETTLTDCSIVGASDYTGSGNSYTARSNAIRSWNNLTLNNCYVWGGHAGITMVGGNLNINGGTYDGYGHGGLYLGNASSTNHIYNAEINWAPMYDGKVSDTVAGTNGAAMYIGGASNITVYIDNCDFNMIDANGATWDGGALPLYGIVLKKSSGESNNTVYISNSYVEEANYRMFRDVGYNNNTVYNGVGNDFSNANVVHNSDGTCFIDTNDSYAAN